MKEPFRAFRIHRDDDGIAARFDDITLADLSDGDVVIRVTHSSVNYKDALAATGAAPILRNYPLVGGIDLAGTVERSDDDRYKTGDAVLVTGCDLSETRDGGYAEYARVPGDAVIPLPAGLDAWHAMCLGTAGFTAALAIHRMEQNGQEPPNGPVIVTGASGGVGSLAIDMLAGRGYEVVAVSGKAGAAGFLQDLGAARVIGRADVDYGHRPLEKTQWAGAIDNVGGDMLAWLTRTVDYQGNIASIGLAGGHQLETTVMPFILRGINLLGINSSATPRPLRLAVWARIAGDLMPRNLDKIGTRTVELAGLPAVFGQYLRGEVTGRTVVDIAGKDSGTDKEPT